MSINSFLILVVVVDRFSTEEQLVHLANDSPYGLAAAVFSRDVTNALNVANKLDVGTVWVNTHSIIEFNVPFGGYKRECKLLLSLSTKFSLYCH